MEKIVHTIGHSNHPKERLLELLKLHGINAVADVRSRPYSRFNPQFDRETLQKFLKENAIRYVFFGDELGARSDTPSCYVNGKVQYSRLAKTAPFLAGLSRIERGITEFRIALMCAEKDPLECHRSILVARQLDERGLQIRHILEDGRLETQREMLSRLAKLLHLREQEQHLFRSAQDLIEDAYRLQEQRIAYELAPEGDVSAA